MAQKRLAFVGGGNMASSIIGGLVNAGYPSNHITVFEPNADLARSLQTQFGTLNASSNDQAVLGHPSGGPADVVLFCVKPQVMQVVAKGVAGAVQKVKPLVVSIAAGIRSVDLERWLGGTLAIVRVMPNTPALLLEGASGLVANGAVTPEQKEFSVTLLKTVSKSVEWVDSEHMIDVTTGLSGSGPAYFFLLLEVMEDAAVKLGMPRETARALAAQTCIGAGRMALEEGKKGVDCAELRRRVTSPGGTTAAGLTVLEDGGFRTMVESCVNAATHRGTEMGELFGKDT
ncbi:pyrroline-5-carboxylate reductase [Gonapodya prolifera JEL478]|uniref:Pyrroline-5-carboxylate reductase n=1 Tax=Gonapodya prolifera (strain JEL478) TaxID=1344416 RepID=A0A139ACB6_GONPJ|nr:pyrroline-5-carboxylate reductase [Gonapodya prolifera JEL478]|eukprot:KXS14410.1 pyrroline-5-carboxylate reductase [Gonapodya prolifera JEL478]